MKVFLLFGFVTLVASAPGGVFVQKEFVAGGGLGASGGPPVTFDGGNVGVNFGGYHASAGLGGLLSGDATKGGLHAEAGTGHGQEAAAGLGGAIGGSKSGGVLYAGATSGGGAAAAAGFSGETGVESAAYGHKTIHHNTQVISEKTFTETPKVIAQKTIQEAPVVHRTVIEKTVIPQYVEKTIQVPSYIEKTIRVPTVVEHKVRVPVTPKVVEKTYDEGSSVAQKNANFHAGFHAGAAAGGASGEKVYLNQRPVVQKQYTNPGLFGGFFTRFGAGAGAGGAGAAGNYAGSAYKSTGFFNDIFNIPITTLGAVNNLLNGISGRTSGSFAVSKQYSSGH